MKNNDNAETLKTGETVVLGGWNQPIKAFPTVEIPLDEYKAFIEFKVKGPTTEIPLEQYKELTENNMRMQGKIWDLENQIRDLEYQLEREKEQQGGNGRTYRHCYKNGSGRNHRKGNERFVTVIRRAEKGT